jgi:hypothetical protein
VAALLLLWLVVSIRGVVLDDATRLPVEAASVELRFSSSSASVQIATADKAGAFRFEVDEPGDYTLEASAEGYFGTQYFSQQPSLKINQSDFDSAAPAVEREVTVSIARAAAVTGVLKDGRTQQPLADFSVKAWRVGWHRGKREFIEQTVANTDKKGAFRLETAPGDYLLEIWKAPAANTAVAGRQADYSAKAPAATGYPVIFWPAGDLETMLPLVVRGGAELGTINLSKIAMGRVRASVPVSQCVEGGMVQVLFERGPVHEKATRGAIGVPCGSAFTLANLSPGDYKVVGMALGPRSNGGFAWGPNRPASEVVPVKPADDPLPGFAMTDVHVAEGSDDELDLAFESGFELTQKVECECAEGWQEKVQGAVPAALGADGNFQTVGPQTDAVKIGMSKMPAGMVIKEVLSNGRSTGSLFVPEKGAAAQTMTVVLTDKPARVSTEEARVVMARWPLEMVDGFPDYQVVKGEPAAVAPGTYRKVGVNAEDWPRLDMPGVLESWLSRGQEFSVMAGETRVLRMEENK